MLRLELVGDLEVLEQLDIEHLGHLEGIGLGAGGVLEAEQSVTVGQGQEVQEVVAEGTEGEADEDEAEVGDGVLVVVAVAELDALVTPPC